MKQILILSVAAAVVVTGTSLGVAGEKIEEAGVIVCVNDKWDEKEIAKGHKVVDYSGRCVKVPDDAKAPKMTEDCKGQYEYLPDESWKAKGVCTGTFKGGDTVTTTWEEGSHLTANPYTTTGGTGRYKGASGGGTYAYDQLTETLFGGRYSGAYQLP